MSLTPARIGRRCPIADALAEHQMLETGWEETAMEGPPSRPADVALCSLAGELDSVMAAATMFEGATGDDAHSQSASKVSDES